jgi:hypothetical protein
MVKKKIHLSLKRERAEGYLAYPSADCKWGFTPLLKWYFIDTTGCGFDQGSFSVREGVFLASSRAMSAVWPLEAMGSWVCIGLFGALSEGFVTETVSLSCLSFSPSA